MNCFSLGGDYSLIIVKDEMCDVPAIQEIIESFIPSAIFNQNVGSELKYTLPVGEINRYSILFEELEDRNEELGIMSYGVRSTTMEEIFLR